MPNQRPLSLWERVRVRASGSKSLWPRLCEPPHALTPAPLPERERTSLQRFSIKETLQ